VLEPCFVVQSPVLAVFLGTWLLVASRLNV